MNRNRPLSFGSRRREEADWIRGILSQSASSPRRLRAQSGFTLVEIALSVAIIGFALVAIIGVLPAGLNVQRENREETIVVHDANYFLDAIRGGARGLDDLTNYVEAITNVEVRFDFPNQPITSIYGYTYTDYTIDGVKQPARDQQLNVLTNGARIIGLLSTPKLVFPDERGRPKPFAPASQPVTQTFTSNYVIAYVRALSGPAFEKAPQNNALVRDLAFRYRMIAELAPYSNWNTNWVDFQYAGLSTNEIVARSNYWQVARMLQGNMHEVRLLFRWPINSRREAGNQRQTFRTVVGGALTNDQPINRRWFVEPTTYRRPQ